jgi:hypothetical protein
MILIDANLLACAQVSSFRQYKSARAWLDAQLNGNSPWSYHGSEAIECNEAGEPFSTACQDLTFKVHWTKR